MPNTTDVNMDEDISAEIMTTLSAALVMNPKFNFGKLMELSTEVNSDKNKSMLADIISLAFLNFLEMNDAAETLSSDSIAAFAGFQALNLDKKESLSWFIRFLTVMNPAIIATLSQTLMNVVNGLMVQNTRVSDVDKMQKVKTKMDTFVKSGEIEKRTDKLIESKPVAERNSRKEVSNLGLIGWKRASKSSKRRESKSSSISEVSQPNKDKKSSLKATTFKDTMHDDDASAEGKKTLHDYLSKMELDEENIMPEDSISQASKDNILEVKVSAKEGKKNMMQNKRKVSIRKEDSVISD